MNLKLKLSVEDAATFNSRITHTLAWALLVALADLFRGKYPLTDSREMLPIFSTTCLTMEGEIDVGYDLFDSLQEVFACLTRASMLPETSERLLKTVLADRLLKPDARLPIAVKYMPKQSELLTYNMEDDVIRCQTADWAEVIGRNIKPVRALANIYAAGLRPELEIDGVCLKLPYVSPSMFDHGVGAGHLRTSTGLVTGILWHAREIEIRIEGFRENKVIRAQLSETARLAAMQMHPSYTVAVQFSETAPHLPMLPQANGRVIIERMWDFQQQSEFAFS